MDNRDQLNGMLAAIVIAALVVSGIARSTRGKTADIQWRQQN